MSTGWDEAEFAKRVSALAHARGMSVTAVMRQAGLTGDFLAHPPRSDRRIDSITRIARVLQVSVSHLVGDDPTHPSSERPKEYTELFSLVAHFARYLENGDYVSTGGESTAFEVARRRLLTNLIDGLGEILAAQNPPMPPGPLPEKFKANPAEDQAADS